MPQWRCRFALESGQPCGKPATYGGYCDAHTAIAAAAAETCHCGAPALGEAALADDMYTAHPTLCAACAASDYIMACGVCGRLGTEESMEAHREDAHYTVRPSGTTASAERVAQCLASLSPNGTPICTACGYLPSNYHDLLGHAKQNHLEITTRGFYQSGTIQHSERCRAIHSPGLRGPPTTQSGFCRWCIRRHPSTLQWVCEPCGRVEIGLESPAEHYRARHGNLIERETLGPLHMANVESMCRVCGTTLVDDHWTFLGAHFLPTHVANLVCPLEGCCNHDIVSRAAWAQGALQRHIARDHYQMYQPVMNYRASIPLFVRNGFVLARSARLGLRTDTTASAYRRMMCSTTRLVEKRHNTSTTSYAAVLADYLLALNSPGPLLRELCWDSTRSPTDINGLKAAVIARFHAVTEPRCIPVGSRKSYANLPVDMWRVIMAQLSYHVARALGQTCRRLWAVYGDVWQGPTDALLTWLRPLSTDIHREGQCDTCDMCSAEAYFVLTAKEIEQALGRSEDGYYSVRSLAHTALLKYGSLDAFKAAYVRQLARAYFPDTDTDASP